MELISRRLFTLGLGTAVMTTAACNNGVGSNGGQTIDGRVDATLEYLYGRYPGTRDLAAKSVGMLVMPVITKAGFGLGGSYGRGALRVGGVSVDYYYGWAAGADVEYVFNDQGDNLSAETTTISKPVVAVVFGQAGLIVGATLEGTKYTRIIP